MAPVSGAGVTGLKAWQRWPATSGDSQSMI